MGCDIHLVVEWREAGATEWVGVYSSDRSIGKRSLIERRDYDFFAEVAHVRGSSPTGHYPRNLPKDVSRLAWLLYMAAPTDHHSVSHMTIGEFVDAWRRCNPKEKDVRPDFAVYDLLGTAINEDDGDHRIVFWFDN